MATPCRQYPMNATWERSTPRSFTRCRRNVVTTPLSPAIQKYRSAWLSDSETYSPRLENVGVSHTGSSVSTSWIGGAAAAAPR
jgi:hypothetical protein